MEAIPRGTYIFINFENYKLRINASFGQDKGVPVIGVGPLHVIKMELLFYWFEDCIEPEVAVLIGAKSGN